MPRSSIKKNNNKVLLIDTVSKDKCTTQASLFALNLEIISANNGDKALKIAAKTPFALILIDLFLPDISSFIMLDRLRGFQGDVPIIATTYANSAALQKKCLEQGFDLFLSKPISQKDLLFNLQFFLELNSL